MKRLVLTLVAGAFGILLALPIAHAENYKQASKDAYAVHVDNRHIRKDERIAHKDLRHDKFRAARREDAKIDRRSAAEQNSKEELNSNVH
jgi:predicted outer membrane lipoprotein